MLLRVLRSSINLFMILGTVVGTVVSEQRADSIPDASYLLVERCNQRAAGKKEYLVALDIIGTRHGEMVVLSQGSAARQTKVTDDKPIDAVIIGIVDCIDECGAVTYRK